MNKMIFAPGDIDSDMRYATGFAAPDNFLYFEFGSRRCMLVSALEFDRANSAAQAGVEVLDAAEFSDFGGGAVGRIRSFAARHNLTEFMVPGNFPLLTADMLRREKLRIVPCEGNFFPQREFKRADEKAEIIRALRIAENAVRHACDVLGEAAVGNDGALIWRNAPLTSEILRREIDLHIAGCDASGCGTIAAGGVQGAEPHNSGSGALRAGSPIVMDVFPRLNGSGYWGDLTRTVCKKNAPEIVRRAFDAVKKARDTAKEAIRPGAVPSAIHNAAAAALTAAGFPTGRDANGFNYGFFHGLGHGVGLDIHEQPRLSPLNSAPLRGGEVVTVEPGVYDHAWGGMRLEDMVFVNAQGAECLTELETILVID